MDDSRQPDPQLIHRYITGEIGPEDRAYIESWRREHDAEYKDWLKLWEEIQVEEPDVQYDSERAWEVISRRITPIDLSDRKRRFRPVLITALAACFLLIAVAAYFMKTNNTAWTVIEESTLTKRSMTLPDGTEVVLGAGSSLKYREHESRTVNLQGRAFFHVVKSEIPFEVTTPQATITVLGTQFDVWSRTGRTDVTLKEGRVQVTNTTGETQILSPTQQSICDGSGFLSPVRHVKVEPSLAWMQGEFVFTRQPLIRILDELAAQHQIPIELGSGIDPRQSVTGSFKSGDLPGILEQLGLTLNLDVIQSEATYRLEVINTQ